MDRIKLVHLHEIEEQKIIDLMNNEMVGKQLPLLADGFSAKNCHDFLKEKRRFWDEYGFGPWAFIIENKFAGWGGLQPESGDADFALVLHPKFWGWGHQIFKKTKDHAFNKMNLNSITILLPPSRPNSKAVTHFGFIEDGEMVIDGEVFLRFRLTKPLSSN